MGQFGKNDSTHNNARNTTLLTDIIYMPYGASETAYRKQETGSQAP